MPLARCILVSGTLRTDAVGLYLKPDRHWARMFGTDDGWYVARWPEVAAIELRQGGRYSIRRARLRVLDASGQALFRGEVALRGAIEMLRHTDLVERTQPGMLDRRRYVVETDEERRA
jgi:hypothetical protein